MTAAMPTAPYTHHIFCTFGREKAGNFPMFLLLKTTGKKQPTIQYIILLPYYIITSRAEKQKKGLFLF
jgi:hypothetical protein